MGNVARKIDARDDFSRNFWLGNTLRVCAGTQVKNSQRVANIVAQKIVVASCPM